MIFVKCDVGIFPLIAVYFRYLEMIVEVLKTFLQILNFLLWLTGVAVFVLVGWILWDYDTAAVTGDLLELLDGAMSGAGGGGARCQLLARDMVEEVTVHVSTKLCSLVYF